MDAEFADAWATDPSTTQAAKPKKPFLKRGEGVTKRLNAYKQRPAKSGATGSTDEVGDASRPTASDQADGASSSYWAADVTSQPAGVPRSRSGDQGVQQQQQQQLGSFEASAADAYQFGAKGTRFTTLGQPACFSCMEAWQQQVVTMVHLLQPANSSLLAASTTACCHHP
jgi:hypothetical protein